MGYASCPSGHESRKLGVCGERQSQVPVWLGRVIIATLISGIILLGTVIPACAAPNHITWSVPAGTNPIAVAVNKTTNKTYVANQGSNNVTIIEGSGSTTTITAGKKSAGTVPFRKFPIAVTQGESAPGTPRYLT